MSRRWTPFLGFGTAFAVLLGCTEKPLETSFAPEYMGIETLLLDNEDVASYGRCAAAQYALIRGFGFARHVRTNVDNQGGVWRGDAVYTISAALPDGLKTIDAEVTVRDCGAQGIPTV